MVELKNGDRAHTILINLSLVNIVLMNPIRSEGAISTSSGVLILS
jgi:hypothetical protein